MTARPAAARQAHHPRDHADLRHARARLQLDARGRQGRPRQPAPRRASSSTRTPASRTTTCATTTSTSGSRSPSSRTRSSGSTGTLDVMAAKTGARVDPPAADAEAVQDPHGPRDGGRAPTRSPTAGEAVEPRELDPIELSDEDVEVIRATQGPMPVIAGAVRARPPSGSASPGRGAARGSSRCASATACAASPRSSSTAARASPPTAWACGRCREDEILETGRRMAAFRGISHCYQRPTYADWPYSVFTMAHGRSKEECDAVLDSIAEHDRASASARRCTRAPSSRRSGCSTSPTRSALGGGARGLTHLALRHALGGALPARAARAAGRRELAGAGDALDRPRPDLHRARRGRRAHRRRRQHLRRLRLLVGAADPRPRPPGGARGGRPTAAAQGTTFGAPTAAEVELAELVARADAVRRHAAHDVLRHRGDDERDPARARRDRPREAAQVRRRLPRPRRRAARRGGLRPRHAGHPGLAGRAGGGRRGDRRRAVERRRRRCAPRSPSTSSPPSLAEPYPANMGLVPPAPRLPRAAARAGDRATARCWSSTRSSPASASPPAARRS